MAKVKIYLAAFICTFLLFSTNGRAQTFVNESSSIGFVIKNMGMNVKGKFTEFTMAGRFVSSDLPGSHFEVEIAAKSVDTGTKARDKHLRNEDYFEVEKYPKITFRSEKISKTKTGFEAVGKLKMHDTEKEVIIPFLLTKKGEFYFLKGELKIDRTDYNVGENSFIMGEDVKINIVCALKY